MCSVAQLHPILCDLVVCSPAGSSVHGSFQARILEWLPFPPPGDLPGTGTEPTSLASPALEGGFFSTEPPGKPDRAGGDPKSCSWPLLSRSLGPNGTARHVNEYWLGQKRKFIQVFP